MARIREFWLSSKIDVSVIDAVHDSFVQGPKDVLLRIENNTHVFQPTLEELHALSVPHFIRLKWQKNNLVMRVLGPLLEMNSEEVERTEIS